MNLDRTIAELRARLELTQGSPTLLLAVGQSDAELAELHRVLFEILGATPMTMVDLGACKHDFGPARWSEITAGHGDSVFMLRFASTASLTAISFARRLNAERQWLQQLAGPVVLLVSRETEKLLRQHAHDFFTWLTSYELPGLDELGTAAARLGVSAERLKSSQPSEEPLRFLHISDLHLRPQAEKRYDQDRVLSGLLTLLERDRASFPLDLIFVTGDLAHAGKPEEYAQVAELLQRLLAVTGVAKEHLFVVPGNHDVQRGVGRWLLRTLRDDEEAVAFFLDGSHRKFHRQKFAAYEAELGRSLGSSRPLGLGVGEDAVEIVELRGRRIAVASFNSAWFAQDDGDHGKLWLGEANVSRALDRIAGAQVSMAVALLHHPFEDLHPDDRAVVEPLVERGFDVVLRGHLHANRTRSILSQRGGYVELAAPAAYQGSKWQNGCFFGELRAQARTVTVKPYTFGSLADPWVLDTKVFPEDEKDGYCRTFTVPAKQRAPALWRAAAAEAMRNAPAQVREEITRSFEDAGETKLPEASTQPLLLESPEVWRGVLGKESPELALVDEILRQGAARPVPKIVVRDLASFEAVIREAAELWLTQVAAHRLHPGELSQALARIAFAAALEVVVAATVTVEPMLPGRLRPDILITDRAGSSCVVEFTRWTASRLKSIVERGLVQVDRYLMAAGAKYGALVFVSSVALDAREPGIERARSPGGHDVLVVHL